MGCTDVQDKCEIQANDRRGQRGCMPVALVANDRLLSPAYAENGFTIALRSSGAWVIESTRLCALGLSGGGFCSIKLA